MICIRFFVLSLFLWVTITEASVYFTTLEKALIPTNEKIVYLGIGTYCDSEQNKAISRKNSYWGYAQSIPYFVKKFCKDNQFKDQLKIILIDPNWRKYKQSALYTYLNKNDKKSKQLSFCVVPESIIDNEIIRKYINYITVQGVVFVADCSNAIDISSGNNNKKVEILNFNWLPTVVKGEDITNSVSMIKSFTEKNCWHNKCLDLRNFFIYEMIVSNIEDYQIRKTHLELMLQAPEVILEKINSIFKKYLKYQEQTILLLSTKENIDKSVVYKEKIEEFFMDYEAAKNVTPQQKESFFFEKLSCMPVSLIKSDNVPLLDYNIKVTANESYEIECLTEQKQFDMLNIDSYLAPILAIKRKEFSQNPDTAHLFAEKS